jgi:hypothetical protein
MLDAVYGGTNSAEVKKVEGVDPFGRERNVQWKKFKRSERARYASRRRVVGA